MHKIKLEQLLEDIKACSICREYLPLAPRPVFQIHPEAKILVAGQAPGVHAHESGIPFDDQSGERLRQWMRIDKTTFYDPRKIAIIPMGFCYPGTGKSGDLPPRPECAEAWRQSLLQCLPEVQLSLLIGLYAQKWHLAHACGKNLTETVKVWRNYWPNQLPLPHPSPRNNIWMSKNPWFEQEIIPVLRARVKALLK